jgi:gamma-glutamyltranspeptidase / glutathione hydrolase
MKPGARTATSRTGMVASAFPDASQAGVDALAQGGNAVDAAVAAGWALAVCEPSASGLGGQTVMMLRLADGTTKILAGWCRAPLAASRTTISRPQQRRGLRACAAPTTPGTLAHAQRRYGLLSRQQVMAPAIRLAEQGYRPTALQRRQLRWCSQALAGDQGARGFLGAAAEIFRQPGLAWTLQRIAEHGAEDFHRGEIARKVIADMRSRGGLIGAEDLAAAEHPTEPEPLRMPFAGAELLTMPPPGGGIELAQALLELGSASAEEHWQGACADAVRLAFTLREQRAWGPEEWLRETGGALPARGEPSGPAVHTGAEEAGETTHVCAADEAGNVVSLTQSIQSLYGAKAAHPELGFLYNNYLLTCPRRPHGHRLAPRAFARSNAAPTLVLDHDGRPRLALGAAGSRRIVSALVQVLGAVLARGERLEDAVAAPRVHARLDGIAWVERDGLTEPVVSELERRGFAITPKAARSFAMGAVQAIECRRSGTLVGVADGRRDGEPRGL